MKLLKKVLKDLGLEVIENTDNSICFCGAEDLDIYVAEDIPELNLTWLEFLQDSLIEGSYIIITRAGFFSMHKQWKKCRPIRFYPTHYKKLIRL